MRSLRTATKSSPHLPQLEKARVQQRRPNAAKNKLINFLKKGYDKIQECGSYKKAGRWRDKLAKGFKVILCILFLMLDCIYTMYTFKIYLL